MEKFALATISALRLSAGYSGAGSALSSYGMRVLVGKNGFMP